MRTKERKEVKKGERRELKEVIRSVLLKTGSWVVNKVFFLLYFCVIGFGRKTKKNQSA